MEMVWSIGHRNPTCQLANSFITNSINKRIFRKEDTTRHIMNSAPA
jgi:hypothetical protein